MNAERDQLIREAISLHPDPWLLIKEEVHEEMNRCRGSLEGKFNKTVDDHIAVETAKYETIVNQLNELKEQLNDISILFQQGKTTLTVLKYLGIGGSLLWGFILWSKDHIKL